MMTDPIADMLTRMRNAIAVKKEMVLVPYSKLKEQVVILLEKNGYVLSYEKIEADHFYLKIKLKYNDKKSAIINLKRISKPGRRVYAKKDNLPIVLNNLGIAIISTSRGLMTNKEAKKYGLGGEIVCEIY